LARFDAIRTRINLTRIRIWNVSNSCVLGRLMRYRDPDDPRLQAEVGRRLMAYAAKLKAEQRATEANLRRGRADI